MIGNLSFEEHDRYFTKMYNCLKYTNRNWDLFTILKAIKCKVILDQERENIKHNLNIKNVCDTPMVKDFEIWSDWVRSQNEDSQDEDEDSQNEDSQDENLRGENSGAFYLLKNEEENEINSEDSQDEDEDSQDEDEDSQDEDEDDDNYSAFEEFCRSSEASSNGVLRYRPIPPEIPEDY